MKNIYLFSLLFFFVLNVSAQNIIVDYDTSTKMVNLPYPNKNKTRLIITDTASIYKILSSDSEGRVIDAGKETSIYKDLTNNILYKTYLFDMTVKGNLSKLFDWQLVSGSREILGYECKKAQVFFHGRDYEAWYAPAIPVPNGPYKFHGLPGLILSIRTTKEGADVFKMEIEAKGIQFPDEPTTIINPFENKKSYSWKEFTDKYTKFYEKMEHYVKRDATGVKTVSVSKGGIEIYVDE